jgi:DNA-binding LytR/AlgR family response regulator
MSMVPATGETLRLPRELGWLYLIAPLLTAPLLVHDLLERTWTGALREIVAAYIPFLAIPLACHALYETAVPRWIAHVRLRSLRFTAHAAVNTVAALLVGAAIWPLHQAVCESDNPFARYLLVCVVITSAFVLPALFVQELRARAEKIERAERAQRQLALEAQLQALQARTNPHFFFNSINTVACLIPEDPELAERTLERIADIVRYALETSPAREVSLTRELAIVRDYLEVQSARFGTRLRWSVDLEPAAADAQVPPLIVQPLVENAVLHGVGSRPLGGEVAVRARRVGPRRRPRPRGFEPQRRNPHLGCRPDHAPVAAVRWARPNDVRTRAARRLPRPARAAVPGTRAVRVLIVDDEAPARRRLIRMISAMAEVTVAGEAGDADTALAQVAALAPDIVLLDIRLPGMDGLALAARYAHLPPIVFVTAHNEFALRAFELDAVDYLVKPVRPERLIAAVLRARRRLDARASMAALASLAAPAQQAEQPASGIRIVVIERGALRMFDARAVSRFWASDKYTLFLAAGEERLTQEPLAALAARLEPHGFMRVHRGELVNLARVRAVRTEHGHHLAELDDGQVARVGRRVFTAFKAALGV